MNDIIKLLFLVNVKMVRLCKCFFFDIMFFGYFDFFVCFIIKFVIIMEVCFFCYKMLNCLWNL